jgi:hypothetical protein
VVLAPTSRAGARDLVFISSFWLASGTIVWALLRAALPDGLVLLQTIWPVCAICAIRCSVSKQRDHRRNADHCVSSRTTPFNLLLTILLRYSTMPSDRI